MLTAEKIYDYIRTQQLPFWRLYRISGYNRSAFISDYKGDNAPEGATDTEKLEKGIHVLETTLALWKDIPGTVFLIKCRPKVGLNNDSEREPGEFTLDGKSPDSHENGQQGMAGFPVDYAQMGYVPQSQMAAQLALSEERAELRILKMLHERDREDFKEEIKEKEAKYNSEVGRIEKAAVKLIDKYLLDDSTENLAGEAEKETTDPKEKEVETIAQFLFDELESPEDVKIIGRVIQGIVNRNKNKTNDNETETETEKE